MRQKIIEELMAIGFARATDYLSVREDKLEVRATDELPRSAGAAIASIERSTTGLKVKFYDKLKALELLGKCCGLFETGPEDPEDNGLLEAILQATKGELSGAIQEIQFTADDGHDLVESTGAEPL